MHASNHTRRTPRRATAANGNMRQRGLVVEREKTLLKRRDSLATEYGHPPYGRISATTNHTKLLPQ